MAMSMIEQMQKLERQRIEMLNRIDDILSGEPGNDEEVFNLQDEISEVEGELMSMTIPNAAYGGYPIIYYTRDGERLCGDCAKEWFHDVVGAETYDEGPDFECDGDCSQMIESSYGEPEVES